MAMTREQARAAAIKLRALKPELQAMNLDALIAKIMVNEGNTAIGESVMTPGGMSRESAFDGLPQSAIASALMLNPPQMVTPASPAPMRPGTALVAPKPTAPAVGGPFELPEDVRQRAVAEAVPAEPEAVEEPLTVDTFVSAPKEGARPSRYRRLLDETISELNSREALMTQARDQGVEVPLTEQARIRALTQRANMLKGYVEAEEAAEIPEEFQSALAAQEQRLQRREERLAESKRLSPWQALLAGSAAMGEGRKGESTGQALSRGLQVGLRAYAQAKNENEEGIEGVGEAREAAVLKRYELIQKARDEAVNMIRSGMTMDKDIAELAKIDDETALRTALLEPTIRKGKAEAGMAEFELGAAPQKLAADLAVAGERAGAYRRSNTGKTGGDGIKGAATLLASFDRDAKIYSDTIKDPLASDADKENARRNLADVNLKRMALRNAMMGEKNPLSAKGGAKKPDFVYVTGKGLQKAN